MKRVGTTVALVSWTALMVFVNGIDKETIIALILALPVMFFALYLIWVDSKRPFNEQWRYANRKQK